MKQASRKLRSRNRGITSRRRGSTLLIVMVLMGMLALLGVIFYTFAKQERSNAEYYAAAAKQLDDPSLDADALFDFALEQIIVGTDARLKRSMLWGSRYSLLSNALGVGYHQPGDLHPFNGEGVNVIFDSTTGMIGVDQDRDGNVESAHAYLLDWVDSVAATKNIEAPLTERQLVNGSMYFPQPDVGYSYPDINNPMLCYVGKVRDQNGQVHQVVKPSYMLPGLLRNPTTGAPNTTWYNDPTTASRVMRGHPNHLYVFPTQSPTTVSRYLTDAEAVSKIGPGAYGFPFQPMAANYDTTTSTGAQYTLGRMGPYSKTATPSTGDDPIEFDYDNDGDGIPESILMDLDYPPQQDASGKTFVPLFLITIHDLDALINLSVHGNLAKILYGPGDIGMASTQISNTTSRFGTDQVTGNFYYISQSNLGLGPAEVNPAWGLTARYGIDNTSGTVFSQHRSFFGALPTAGASPAWGETANMELLWSKIGRPQYSSGGTIQNLYPGAYGEENVLYQALTSGYSTPGGAGLPRPGISQADDNNNVNEGQGIAPFFQHPLDFTGQGSYITMDVTTGYPKLITWINPGSNANQFISYTKYNNNTYSSNPTGSNILWAQHKTGTSSDLVLSSLTQGNGDDPYEIAYYNLDKRTVDNLFDPDEMLYLRLNNSEVNRLNVTSRLANLLPFNFAKTTADNARGQQIRGKFTTISNDRKNFGLPYTSALVGGRSWEYSTDTATLGGNQGPFVRNPASNTFRFPPEFGTGLPTPVRRYSSVQPANPPPDRLTLVEDPIRPPVRALLEMDNDPIRSAHGFQRKLSINQLLTFDSATGNYYFRPLTPHPDDPGTTTISSLYDPIDSTKLAPYPWTNAASQEYWARRDRQQLARDIYVLLYLLGHGDDTKNTATTANPNPTSITDTTTVLYSDAQLREMAQFAVNMVDAMDRDNVMTRFEYDKDLSDGWNLDDDPYGPAESSAYTTGSANYNASFPNDGARRGEVFGVERHDLSLSEVLAIHTAAISPAANHTATAWDDGTAHAFGFVELYNQSPFDVTFQDNEAWQVVIRQDAGMGAAWERRLSFKSGAQSVPSGQRYTIGSADTDVLGATNAANHGQTKSLFVVSSTGGAGVPANYTDWAVPNQVPLVGSSNGVTYYGLDLMSVTTPTTTFRIEDGAGNDKTTVPGSFMTAFSGTAPTEGNLTTPVQFVLRRRAHPNRSRLVYADTNDNPWVDVDIMTMPKITSFTLTSAADTAATIQTQLKGLLSYERPQPFAQDQATTHPAGPPASSISVANSSAAAINTIWQPHFDRDFTSVMDLMPVPVCAPKMLTQRMRGAMLDTPEGQLTDQLGGGAGYLGAKSASAKFMVPEDPSNWGGITNRTLDNRWHRLLEFVEVLTRTNQNLGVGSDLSITRVPAKMNPNMFRNVESLGAVLDDTNVMTMKLDGTDFLGNVIHAVDPEAGELYDNSEKVNRDWWDQFLKSRDRIDPYWHTSVGVDIPLPGLPGSRPFRSLADVSYNAVSGVKHASVQDTILRALPTDVGNIPDPMAPGQSRRRLLELGSIGDHSNPAGMQLDPLIRNRLLSKLANNTTTRSNTFAIFVSVKYFSAVSDSANNGAIRIGGPLNGKQAPEHRGFFVVDRSKLEQGQYSGLPNYDFRTFVEYRKTLATQ
jgi:hypothetical protein